MASPTPIEARFSYSDSLPGTLERLRCSLLISTYQAGQLVVVGVRDGKLTFSFHQFDRCMGLAVAPGRLAVGTRRQVWMLVDAPELAEKIGTGGIHDACYLTRSSRFTGEIQGHELGFGPDGLWVVNTLFGCLALVSEEASFTPVWRPPFLSALAAEDRCHLNGMAMEAGKPRFVSAMAETDTAGGWRPVKATAGVVLRMPDGSVVCRGLCMPHSPRLADGRLWVLDSGRGALVTVDEASGTWSEVCRVPGYTRGLAFGGPFAFVGMSRIRETSVFSGIPIAERRGQLKCGVAVVELKTGREAGRLEFASGVEEVFDVQLLPGPTCAYVSGPDPVGDGQSPIWLAGRWKGER